MSDDVPDRIVSVDHAMGYARTVWTSGRVETVENVRRDGVDWLRDVLVRGDTAASAKIGQSKFRRTLFDVLDD